MASIVTATMSAKASLEGGREGGRGAGRVSRENKLRKRSVEFLFFRLP